MDVKPSGDKRPLDMQNAERRVLHLDMDAFYASVELLSRPDLRGKPVVIGGRGDPTRRGVATTATYEARAFGIHSGMALRTAYKLCPQAVILPTNFPEYQRWSRRFKDEMLAVCSVFEDRGIDEAYLDISALPDSSETIGRELKQRILAATGMTCSVGIAPNKLLAKLSSELDKPDGLTVLAVSEVPARIWPLDVRKLQGVGPKAERKLKALGWATIGQLAAVPLHELQTHFGDAYSNYLHAAANGRDGRPVVSFREPKSVSRETTFQEDLREWQDIARVLAELSKRVAADLERKGYLARTVGIKLRFEDFHTVTRDRTLEVPTGAALDIRRAAFECLSRVEIRRRVRLIGVRLGELHRIGEAAAPAPTQPDLLSGLLEDA